MTSPREPGHGDQHEAGREYEPSEIVDAFRQPGVRLDPPPGAFGTLRRRAAARRRRRVLGVTAAVLLCLGGTTMLAAVSQQGGDNGTPSASGYDGDSSTPAAGTTPGQAATETPSEGTSTDPGASEGASSPSSSASSSPSSESPSSQESATESQEGSATTGICQTDALALAVAGTEGAAGSVYYTLEFTNTGDSACTMTGYPGVSLVAGDGEQIGSAAERSPQQGEGTTVRLAPGDTTRVDLQVAQAGNYDDAECEPSEASGFRVYPPDELDAMYLPYDGLTGCQNEDVTLLEVTVVY